MDTPNAQLFAWAAYMRRQGLSPGTIRMRRYELDSWDRWIGARWRQATFRDVEAWIESRIRLGPTAQGSAASHLRAFYRWARREGLAAIDPCADVVTAKRPQHLPRPAPPAVVSAAVGLGQTRTERICALMAYGGLRCCEVARLRWEDVDVARGMMLVRGKGDRDRPVPIAPPLAPILAGGEGRIGPVIAQVEGVRPLTAQRIGSLVGRHLRRLGSDCTAHQLRHYAGTHVLERADGNLLVVRDFLGHSHLATTEIYAQLSPGAVVDAVARW